MFTIFYDRNYRNGSENEASWKLGERIPDIAPHRIVELHADGEAKVHLEATMGTIYPNRDWCAFYGDLGRTVYINLEDGE